MKKIQIRSSLTLSLRRRSAFSHSLCMMPVPAVFATEKIRPSVTIDYPLNGSIFPPEITPPTFLWRDAAEASQWRIEIKFADGSAAMHFDSAGDPMSVGEIDQRCVSANERIAEAYCRAGGGAHLDSGHENLGKDQEALGRGPAQMMITGFSRNDPKARIAQRPGFHSDLERPRRCTDLLSRCATDAFRNRKRRHQAAGRKRDSTDPMAAAQHRPTPEPSSS